MPESEAPVPGAPGRAGPISAVLATILSTSVVALELVVRARVLGIPRERLNESDSDGCGAILLLIPTVILGPIAALVAIGLAVFAITRGQRVLPAVAILAGLGALVVAAMLVALWA